MKKVFSLIVVLISLSLVGIIFIQVSWTRNMVMLREEQIKHRVSEATIQVGEDLAEQKAIYVPGNSRRGGILEGFGWEIFGPSSIASRYDIADIEARVKKSFHANNLDNIHFEFGLSTIDRLGNNVFQKVSPGFLPAYQDTLHNFIFGRGLNPLSGSAGENLGVTEILYVVVPDIKQIVLRSLGWNIAASLLFTIIILSAFYLTVRTMLQQKKLGEMKNDFINNMTHEFKTPLATISLAVDAMRNQKVIEDREKMGYFSGIIKEENQRMNRQVETILKASQFERQDVELALKPVSLHKVIRQVVDNFALQLEHVGGTITLFLHASEDTVLADEVHLANLVNNLIDNAIKYAREGVPPRIQLNTSSTGKTISFRIEDNGMGMSRDTVKRIFEKFYRAHTGNRHNVKGFGLGLSYVKSVAEALGGKIKADSTLGKGSVFTLDLGITQAKA